jgi:histidyl-tRNA synthetase
MTKITNISGFPEWLPEEKRAEERIIEQIRKIYTLHGFTPIETPAVELLSTLASKGEINKQIYTVSNLHTQDQEGSEKAESKLALHFDLTVPLARYVAQHLSKLDLPFKRYQLQKVWRGERAQEGRFREFTQFDIDIVGRDTLPICHDAEIVTIVDKVFTTLKIGQHRIKLNNRKLLHGFYCEIGLNDLAQQQAIIIVDKLSKIGAQRVKNELISGLALNEEQANRILSLAELKLSLSDFDTQLQQLAVKNEQFILGILELKELVALVPQSSRANIVIDPGLARGLDYYSGTIIETVLVDHPEFGSVCGGGRYDNLASRFINQKLPGVGVSIGLTRLMSCLLSKKLVDISSKSPTQVLLSVYDESNRAILNETAEKIRAYGIACEVFHSNAKLGKQIEYADRKGIPFVLFQNGDQIEIKNLAEKTQHSVDLDQWCTMMVDSLDAR